MWLAPLRCVARLRSTRTGRTEAIMPRQPALEPNMPATPPAAPQLADHSADRRMLLLAAMALVVRAGGAVGAWALLKLIALAPHLFWFGRFPPAPAAHPPPPGGPALLPLPRPPPRNAPTTAPTGACCCSPPWRWWSARGARSGRGRC